MMTEHTTEERGVRKTGDVGIDEETAGWGEMEKQRGESVRKSDSKRWMEERVKIRTQWREASVNS